MGELILYPKVGVFERVEIAEVRLKGKILKLVVKEQADDDAEAQLSPAISHKAVTEPGNKSVHNRTKLFMP